MKTYSNWKVSGKNLGEFLSIGDEVDEGMFYYFLEVLPPATNLTNLIQIGEPYSHVRGKATFSTLERVGGKWFYRGHCYRGRREEPK